MFLTNLVARNEEMKTASLKSLRGHYSSLLSVSVPEDVNEVVVGLQGEKLEDIIANVSKHKKIEGDRITGGELSEKMVKRLGSLAKQAEDWSAGDLKVDSLHSKLSELLSCISYYE